MPLFLTPELEEFWLSENFSEYDMKAVFDFCYPQKRLTITLFLASEGKSCAQTENINMATGVLIICRLLGNDEPLQPQLMLLQFVTIKIVTNCIFPVLLCTYFHFHL
jgi:hypothetical protein